MVIQMYVNVFWCDNDKLLYAAPFLNITCVGCMRLQHPTDIIMELRITHFISIKNNKLHYIRFVLRGSSLPKNPLQK